MPRLLELVLKPALSTSLPRLFEPSSITKDYVRGAPADHDQTDSWTTMAVR